MSEELNKQWLINRPKSLVDSCQRSENQSHGQDEVYYRAKVQAYTSAIKLAELIPERPQTKNSPLTLEELRECPFTIAERAAVNALKIDNGDGAYILKRYADVVLHYIKFLQSEVVRLSTQPENSPLTLDEFRKMCQATFKKVYGPIWIKTIPDGKISCQITRNLIKADGRCKMPKEWVDAHSVNLLLEDYGKTWLAYRYKPEDKS
jgi:hypothetical protein